MSKSQISSKIFNPISLESSPGFAYTILIPVINERENLPQLLEEITRAVDQEKDLPAGEILVVDGGSSDGTRDFVKNNRDACDMHLRLFECDDENGSLSSDLIRGSKTARGDVLVVIDGDRSHPAETIPKLLKSILKDEKDMMVGSRYIEGGRIEDWSQLRQFISHFSTAIARPFVTVEDPLAGFFAVKKEAFLKYGKQSTGFKIGLEIMARGRDELRVGEVPITFQDRESGQSKMGMSEILAFIKQLIRLSGGNLSGGHALRFAGVGLLGMFVDGTIFYSLLYLGIDLTVSHLGAFFLATVFNFTLNANWTFAESYDENNTWYGILYVKFLTVCLLAFFMRSAILALGVSAVGWASPPAYFLAIVTGSGVNFIGTGLFVFPGESIRDSRHLRWSLLSVLLILYSVIIRLSYADLLNLMPEEAYYWTWSQHLALGYLDHPPMTSWLMGTFYGLLGHTELSLRIPAILSWGVMAYYLYWLSREWFDSTSAYLTVALVSAFPLYFGTGFFMTPDPPLYAAWTASLYYLHRALFRKRDYAWYGAGFAAGIGLISKYTFGLIFFSTALFLILHPPSRKWFFRKEPYLATLISAVVFSPVIVWNVRNGWVSFFWQGMRRWNGGVEPSLLDLLNSSLVSLTPLGFLGLFAVFLVNERKTGKSSFLRRYLTYPPKRLFSLVFTFLPFSVFLVHSFIGNTKLNWTGPVWFAVFPWFGHAIVHREDLRQKWFGKTLNVLTAPTLVFFLLLWSGIFYAGWTGWLNLSPDPLVNTELTNSVDRMVKSVESLRNRYEKQTSGKQEVYVVGMDKYFLSSWYRFYARQSNRNYVTGRHLFNEESLMWSFWDPPQSMVGKTIVLFSLEKNLVEVGGLKQYFDRVSPIKSEQYPVGQQGIQNLYWRVGFGYHPTNSYS